MPLTSGTRLGPYEVVAPIGNPFFSPDGDWIAYFADGFLKKISTLGGPPVTLCPAGGMRGANWGRDDTIIMSTLGEGLVRVPAAGGEPTPILPPDTESTLGVRFWPDILPGGRAVLFMGGMPPDQSSPWMWPEFRRRGSV